MTSPKNDTMDVREFRKIQDLLVAFSSRDIQVANTLLSWVTQHGVSSDGYLEFYKRWAAIHSLIPYGYFNFSREVEHAKKIRDLERTVEPKEIRRFVRKMRLTTGKFDHHKK